MLSRQNRSHIFAIICTILVLVRSEIFPDFNDTLHIVEDSESDLSPVSNVTIPLYAGKSINICQPTKVKHKKFSSKWNDCEKEPDNSTEKTQHPMDGKGTKEILESLGFSTETYHAKTKDGYILTVYRMVGPNDTNSTEQRGVPVYLNHGMSIASDFWFFQQRNRTLPVKLYNNGYDVWLSNCRGTTFSTGHSWLDHKKDIEYWNFSFHQMGLYDVPAVVDLILRTTGYEKLLYIGFSMGTTQAFIALSEYPEINEKVEAAFLLAPAAFMGHTYGMSRAIARKLQSYEVYTVLNQRTHGRITSNAQVKEMIGPAPTETCSYTASRCGMCDNVWFALHGYNAPQMNRTELPNIVSRIPDMTSVKIFSHYAQFIHYCKFQRYNYGASINMQKYGSPMPPEYKLKNIDTDMYLYYGQSDNMCLPVDVRITAGHLKPGVLKELYLVKDRFFNHLDFCIAKDADKLLYNKVLKDMYKYK